MVTYFRQGMRVFFLHVIDIARNIHVHMQHYLHVRLAPVHKTIFHQCVISYKTEPSELDYLQVYDITHW